jgi:hypothetical protein
LSLDKLVEKAKKLLKGRRVEALGGGTYTVVQGYDGKVSCNCPGYVKKAKCSHSTAVLMLTRSSRKRRPKRSKQ